MKELIFTLLFFVPLSLFAEGQQSVQPIKVNDESEDLQRSLNRLSQDLLPSSGGDGVFYIDRKDKQVKVSTLTVNGTDIIGWISVYSLLGGE